VHHPYIFGPATHTAHINTVIMINNQQAAENSNGETLLAVKNATTASCQKKAPTSLSASFRFHTE